MIDSTNLQLVTSMWVLRWSDKYVCSKIGSIAWMIIDAGSVDSRRNYYDTKGNSLL